MQYSGLRQSAGLAQSLRLSLRKVVYKIPLRKDGVQAVRRRGIRANKRGAMKRVLAGIAGSVAERQCGYARWDAAC